MYYSVPGFATANCCLLIKKNNQKKWQKNRTSIKMLSSQIKDLFKGIFSAWQHTTILSKNDGLCTIIVIITLFKSGFQIQKRFGTHFFLFIRCWWKIVMKLKKQKKKIHLLPSWVCQIFKDKFIAAKGLIISKCLFDVFNFFQKTRENTLHSSKVEFICSFFWKNSRLDNLLSKLTDLY